MNPVAVSQPAHLALSKQRLILAARAKSGARWFMWIAGLSLINTIAAFTGAHFHFIVGLGFTQFVDAISRKVAGTVSVGALFLDVLIAALFIGFGKWASQGREWAFLVGMIVYALDSLLFLVTKDVVSIGFHLFALWCIYRGLKANEGLNQLSELAQA